MKTKLIIPILLAILLVSNVLALTITDVTSSPKEVQPGQKISLDLTIKNGDENNDVEDVKVSLMLNGVYSQTGITLYPAVPLSPYQSSGEANLGTIESKKYKDAGFDLIASSDADSGTYKIPVVLQYTLDDVEKTENGLISVIINAKPVMSVSSDSPGLIKNQANDLTIKLINSGLGDAKFTNVKIGTISNANIIGASTFYIGDINKDDFDSVKISLNVNSNAPGIITIPVELTYKDSTTKEYTETQNLDVKVYTLKQAQALGIAKKSNLGLYITLIVLVIIIYLVYRWFKKRRKNKLANGGK